MIKCEDCGKEFKSTQALGGHMRFVHGVKKDSQAPLFPPKRFITDEQLKGELLGIRAWSEEISKSLDTIRACLDSIYERLRILESRRG